MQDGVSMYGRCDIVPSCLRGDMLAGLHAAHQCVTNMHDRAMHDVFWLGLYKDLGDVKSTLTKAALPLHEFLSPDYPFIVIVIWTVIFLHYKSTLHQ